MARKKFRMTECYPKCKGCKQEYDLLKEMDKSKSMKSRKVYCPHCGTEVAKIS